MIADGWERRRSRSRLAISSLAHLAIYFGKWHMRVDEPVAEEMMGSRPTFLPEHRLNPPASQPEPARLGDDFDSRLIVGADLFFAHVGHSRRIVSRRPADAETLMLFAPTMPTGRHLGAEKP